MSGHSSSSFSNGFCAVRSRDLNFIEAGWEWGRDLRKSRPAGEGVVLRILDKINSGFIKLYSIGITHVHPAQG